ncbi:MAG: ESX secretion-associated protein EspG, partial [Sciscionella sp.]
RAMAARNGDREMIAIFAFPTRTSGAAPQRPVLWVSRLVHGPLAPTLVSFLPFCEPARIRSLSVKAQSLAHADDDARWQPQPLREQPFTFVQKALLDKDEPPEACAAFAKLAASSPRGRGELGVAVLSRSGRREASRRRIILADTEDGRFVLTTLGEHVTVRGGGISDLAQELQRQHGELVQHVRQATR